MMMSLQSAARAVGGRTTDPATWFASVGIDSRAIATGQLFVAIAGERFDGHDFVREALARGAAAACVESDWVAAHDDAERLPLLVVDDARRALQRLAADWRQRFNLPLIGITGSNGKTTVKEMCAAIWRAALDDEDAAVLATAGNLNNDLGVPLTLLRLRPWHRAAVVEMGMNHPGEIGVLTRLARPTVALVNNAQRAHLEGLGSVEAIAEEKGAIYEGLDPKSGIAVINADDPHAGYWRRRVGHQPVRSFGLDAPADVVGVADVAGLLSQVRLKADGGEYEIALGLPGVHNVRNALAAATACLAAGAAPAAVVAGLSAYRGTRGRLEMHRLRGDVLLINDSYNANPDSVRAAIEVLAATPGHRVLVLGDMAEVGEHAGQLHSEVGGHARSCGIEALFAFGGMSALAVANFGSGALHFGSIDALNKALLKVCAPGTVMLVKGSRSMAMERVVDFLLANGGAEPGGDDAA